MIRNIIYILLSVLFPIFLLAQSSAKEAERFLQFEQLRQLDSIKKYAPQFLKMTEKEQHTIPRFWALHYYSMTHYKSNQVACLKMELEAHEGFKAQKVFLGQVKSSGTLANIYSRGGQDIKNGIKYFEYGIDILEKSGEAELGDSLKYSYLAFLMNNLALNKMGIGDFEAALTLVDKANTYLERYPNDNQQLMTLMNLGNINYRLQEYEKSIEYNKSLLAFSKIKKQPRFIYLAINNLAGNYGILEQLDSAIVYLEQSYDFAKKMKDWKALALRASNLGFSYSSKSQFERAEPYYKEALDIAQKYKLVDREIEILNFMGSHYLQKKEPSQTLKIVTPLIDSIQKKGLILPLIQSYEMLYLAYEMKGDFKPALRFYKKMKSLQDSIKGQEIKTNLAEFQTKYETEKKEKENAQLRQAAIIQDLEINRRNIAIGLSILILSLLSLAIYLFGRQRSLKAEKETLLKSQQLKRAQLNPHFFFNALNSIQNLVATSDNKGIQIGYISKFAKLMRQTLEQSIHEFVEIQEEIESLEAYLILQKLRFKNRFDFEIINNFSNYEALYIPSQLIQPFIENSIEHGFKALDKKGQLMITFSPKGIDIVEITITDNGTGLGTSDSDHKSRSQEIITERLALFNEKEKYYFTLNNNLESDVIVGTTATISAPFQRI